MMYSQVSMHPTAAATTVKVMANCACPFHQFSPPTALQSNTNMPAIMMKTLQFRYMTLDCQRYTPPCRGSTSPFGSGVLALSSARTLALASRREDSRYRRMDCDAEVRTEASAKTSPQNQQARAGHGVARPSCRTSGQELVDVSTLDSRPP